MSTNDYIKFCLNIEDNNIYFKEDCCKNVKYKGKKVKAFYGYLTYKPAYCPKCGHANESYDDIINWGWKNNCVIRMPKISGYNTILVLNKQRFYCRNCKRTFTASSNIINFRHQISVNTETIIKTSLTKNISEKNIAIENNVSPNKVNRILNDISKKKMIKNYGHLPTSFGIDEFQGKKGLMDFIILDHKDNTIFDIWDSRKEKDIIHNFSLYPKKERDKVKYITMDLCPYYYKACKKLFKNAELTSDRFHVSNLCKETLNTERKKLSIKSNPDHNKLRHYWKLILKNKNDLSDKKIYSKYFKKKISCKEIVVYLINTNETLKGTYNVYQGILDSIANRDKQKFLNIINSKSNYKISKRLSTTLKTYKKLEKYILNSFDTKLSNGAVEGTNNVIKAIKRTSYGFRSNQHLIARVMLEKGIKVYQN